MEDAAEREAASDGVAQTSSFTPMPYSDLLLKGHQNIRVRDVELRRGSDAQRHREQLARIVLDEMFQFVALLDAEGTLLEVNRAALEAPGFCWTRQLGSLKPTCCSSTS